METGIQTQIGIVEEDIELAYKATGVDSFKSGEDDFYFKK